MPFLTIAPDSRAGAMGDIGAATSPDINSMHWNASKYAYIDEDLGVAISYSPWLKAITNDIKLLYLSGFKRLDKQQVIAGSIRFFNLGQIVFTDVIIISPVIKYLLNLLLKLLIPVCFLKDSQGVSLLGLFVPICHQEPICRMEVHRLKRVFPLQRIFLHIFINRFR